MLRRLLLLLIVEELVSFVQPFMRLGNHRVGIGELSGYLDAPLQQADLPCVSPLCEVSMSDLCQVGSTGRVVGVSIGIRHA